MVEVLRSFWARWHPRLRWIAIGFIVCLFVVVLLQNLEPVEFRLLLSTIAMPRAVVLLGSSIVGFAVGAVWGRARRR